MSRRVSARILPKASACAVALIGFGLWIGFPTAVAYQDMASMLSGGEAASSRWNGFVEKAVAGSVHAAEMPFADLGGNTGSIGGSGLTKSAVGAVALRGKGAAGDIPDEQRVTRLQKRGRIVDVAPVAPPKAFNAGSILERTSMLRPSIAPEPRMAFATPDNKGREVEIATAFYARQDRKPDPAVPSYLADLITSDKADVLATAYAPASPDYATASPFETLLKDEPDGGGRFIPPLGQGDHDWLKRPLPASVFSKPEQTCLANAIYFEARGESTRGQAAVAQVVLNRVRNPAYPKSICGVVYQNDAWKNRCQFSFACDGIKDIVLSPWSYRQAQDVAMAVTAGKIFIPEVGSSTHYYAQYVSPSWARAMKRMTKIGLHIFYRTYGGGWS